MEPNTFLTKEQFEQWIAALESGEYAKGYRELKTENGTEGFSYCCLGVAKEIFYLNKVNNNTYLKMYRPEAERCDDIFLLPNDLQVEVASENDVSESFGPVVELLRELEAEGKIKFGEKFA